MLSLLRAQLRLRACKAVVDPAIVACYDDVSNLVVLRWLNRSMLIASLLAGPLVNGVVSLLFSVTTIVSVVPKIDVC